MLNRKLVAKILSRKEFRDNPPVLLDIGASGKIYEPWKELAKYSICVAFDADAREMKYIEDGSGGYKKAYICNKILTSSDAKEEDFYLTKSPYCSSLLKPDSVNLAHWNFADLFAVEKVVKLKTANLNQVLAEFNVKRIDWFKTDSQGTDLRLFAGLDSKIVHKILVADFEPGVIDAYHGEDKLGALLSYMDKLPFWVDEMKLPKIVRITKKTKKILTEKFGDRIEGTMHHILKSSPFCAEISFINNFTASLDFNARDFLLLFVIAYLKEQYAFALEIASKGATRFDDKIFEELQDIIIKKIARKIKTEKVKKILRKPIGLLKRLI
jgi:hypothetical protein